VERENDVTRGKWYDFFKTYENNPKNKNMLVETI